MLRSDWTAGGHDLAAGLAAGQRRRRLPGGRAAAGVAVHADRRRARWPASRCCAPRCCWNVLDNVAGRLRGAALRRPRVAGARGAGALPRHAVGAEPARPAGRRRRARPGLLADLHRLPHARVAAPGALAGSDAARAAEGAAGLLRRRGHARRAALRHVEGRHARALLPGLAAPAPSADGNNPTLLYGYGGFEVSLLPSYSAASAPPGSSRAASTSSPTSAAAASSARAGTRRRCKAKRQNAYDDFIAVAEDLIRRKASPRRGTSASRAAATAACWWATC